MKDLNPSSLKEKRKNFNILKLRLEHLNGVTFVYGKAIFSGKEMKLEKKLTFTPFPYYVEGKLEKFEKHKKSENLNSL